MYTLTRAAVLANTLTPQWTLADLSHMAVNAIYSNYRKAVIAVTLPDSPDELYVDMDSLKPLYAAYMADLTTLLQSLGDQTLETIPIFPTDTLNYVKYSDVHQIGYKAMLVRRGFNDPIDYPREELTDIELTRPGYSTMVSSIHTHCLVSVNGFFHQTDTDGSRVYIVDGGKSVVDAHCAHIGMTSFMSIGELVKQPIVVDTIESKAEGGALKDGLKFTVKNGLEGKSVILSLGGYLLFPQEGVFYQTGDQSFELNLMRLPYLERLIESKPWIDLSSLKLTPSEINPNMINVAQAWSDDVIRAYLTLSQSFLVIVDTPHLFTNKLHLRQNGFPGTFTCMEKPIYPLIASFGRCCEYWRDYEDTLWTITAMDTFRRNYVFNRQPENTLTNVSNQLSPDIPYQKSLSYLLEIGSFQ